MRACTKCGQEKPLDAFPPNAPSKDGRLHTCRECHNAQKRENYRARAADPAWQERERERLRARRPDREKVAGWHRSYRERYPERHAAGLAVKRAVAQGQLVRPEYCERCEKVCKPDAHHKDYAKQLEVEWLCKSCHGRTRAKVAR